MKGTNDTQILLGFLIFLVALAFVSAQFGTEVIKAKEGWNASYIEANETTIGSATEVIPPPPVCTRFVAGYIPIIGELIDGVACLGGYLGWMISLMFIQSEVQWLYQLILFPILCIIGFMFIRLIRSGGG